MILERTNIHVKMKWRITSYFV